MIDHRFGIFRSSVFRNPSLHIGKVGVKFLQLLHGIEDPEIRGSIASGAGGPLPVPIVGGELVIDQFTGKISFSHTPVNQQMFAQESGSHHAHPVMHDSGAIKLAHSGIHQGVTCIALTPTLKVFRIVQPVQAIVFGFKILVNHPGEMKQDLHKKLPPYKL